MPQLLWDASALTKRYIVETGSATVDALFDLSPPASMIVTYLGYAETSAIQRRKLNQGILNATAFGGARLSLRREIFDPPGFLLMTVSDGDVLAGIGLTDRHNLNASDAAMLAAYLRYASAQISAAAPVCALVACDQRLVRTARAEGLPTLNPEEVPPEEITRFLNAL